MEITWEFIGVFFLAIVVWSLLMGCIHTALEDRRQRHEQEKREEYQMRGKN